MHDKEHPAETLEVLKTLISGEFGIQIQFKGVDQVSSRICANFMATTNYRGAVPKTKDNQRRLAMFLTGQQCVEDLKRSGMTGDYFPRLYGWLRKGGFGVVTHLLRNHPIPDHLNPVTTLHRAPHTSTTEQVILESRGAVEQQVQEQIEQGVPGFAGGWVSSVQLGRLLDETLRMGSRMSMQRRKEMMQAMGYVLHPGLPNGRVHNAVQPDGRRTQLYILENHPARWLEGAP